MVLNRTLIICLSVAKVRTVRRVQPEPLVPQVRKGLQVRRVLVVKSVRSVLRVWLVHVEKPVLLVPVEKSVP